MKSEVVSFKVERKTTDGLDELLVKVNQLRANPIKKSELMRLILGWAAENHQEALELLAANQFKEAVRMFKLPSSSEIERIVKSASATSEKSLAPTSKTAAEEDETR